MVEGPDSLRCNGYNVIALVAIMIAAFEKRFFILSIMAMYAPYLVLCVLRFSQVESPANLHMNLGYMVCTIIILFFTQKKRNENFVKLIEAQVSLNKEIESRQIIIKEKTDEATKLNKLSSQFSPQIVKSIREGQIKIDEQELRNERICAVFIDIVRSTEKVVNLPKRHVQKSLNRFLDTVLLILLKYDLTIDKFHGDGVLAFSNSPVQRIDFIERAALAVLEVNQALKLDEAFYKEYWGEPLQIRSGISVGSASVGFYGSKKLFKTYTAIGAPLPLASRLTALAQPGQILVDHEIGLRLQNHKFNINHLGERSLKGFENEKRLVCELISVSPDISKDEFMKRCTCAAQPLLFLDTNSRGDFVLKCHECGQEQSARLTDLSFQVV